MMDDKIFYDFGDHISGRSNDPGPNKWKCINLIIIILALVLGLIGYLM